MSGRPERSGAEEEQDGINITIGDTLYNEDGKEVGTVRGVQDGGAYISTGEGVQGMSLDHARSGQAFGEAELMWRCTQCGEMGDIQDGLPEQCPNCASEKEELMYWTED